MNKKTLLLLFAVTAGLHLLFPAAMIFRQERTLKTGERVLVKTQPVDPYDVLRGRYVALGYEQNRINQPGHGFKRRQLAYAQYSLDEQGFATVTNLVEKVPGGPSLPVRVWGMSGVEVHYQFTFNRYFLNEKIAPEAEAAYRRMNRGGKTNAWVVVRAGKGRAVLEDLVLDGKPVMDYLEAEADKAP